MSDDALVQVYASGNAIDVQLMRGRLETEGIPCMVKGEPEGPYRVGPAYLLVAPEHQAAASAIIEAVRSGAYALDGSEEIGAGDIEGQSADEIEDATPR